MTVTIVPPPWTLPPVIANWPGPLTIFNAPLGPLGSSLSVYPTGYTDRATSSLFASVITWKDPGAAWKSMVSPLWIVTSREKKSVYSNSRPFSGCWLAGSAWSTPMVTVCGDGGAD